MKFECVLLHKPDTRQLIFELPSDPSFKYILNDKLKVCRDKYNSYVKITVDTPKRPRTTGANSQNHHLNGHIMQIAQETGSSYEAVKNKIKMIAVETMGYPYTDFLGVITPKNESDCDTEECAMLIEAAHILAADLAIVLREE